MKRFILVPLLLAGALCAQQASVTSTTAVDINGHRVSDGPQVVRTKSPTGSITTETLQSVNGRMVPLERVEERIVRDDASGRVVERLIRRYDPQGNPTQPVKETIDEQKRPDGSSTTQTTTYRGDVNGSMQLIEKTVTETRKSGSSETQQREDEPARRGLSGRDQYPTQKLQRRVLHSRAANHRAHPAGIGGH